MKTIDEIIEDVLKAEGGYVNDPNDPGGETNFGISKRAHPDVDIAGLTRELAKAIYLQEYVKAPKFDQIPFPGLQALMVDFGVNSGPGRAIQFLRFALGLEPKAMDALDGETLVELWKYQANPRMVQLAVGAMRAKFIDDLTDKRQSMKKFEEGLESRALSFVELPEGKR